MTTTTNLNLFQVNTTAFDEENFVLLTSLTEEQITKAITPIVQDERVNGIVYDNDMLVEAINKAYPESIAIHYTLNGFDLISI